MAKDSTGHSKGMLPGNMMAHGGGDEPFKGTGIQPGPALSGIGNLQNSNAHDPGAAKKDSMYKSKLESSTPYAVPSVNSWTGGSGTQGGQGAKTRKS